MTFYQNLGIGIILFSLIVNFFPEFFRDRVNMEGLVLASLGLIIFAVSQVADKIYKKMKETDGIKKELMKSLAFGKARDTLKSLESGEISADNEVIYRNGQFLEDWINS